jgi:undecaprenyl diphosphate synthase
MLKHLACIMDGNRRWATQQGLIASYGHKQGFSSINKVIDFCLTRKIQYLSLYTFSIENLQRSDQEKNYLFEVLADEAVQDLARYKDKNVNIRFFGDRTLFPKKVRLLCEQVEKETHNCNGLYLGLLMCYGGRQEIVDTVKRIAAKVKKGDLHESDITPDVFERFLWTAGIPDPDLIVRTGGFHRLSNFLPFQGAYSELYFLDCLWPDITEKDLESAAIYFDSCRKNLGL